MNYLTGYKYDDTIAIKSSQLRILFSTDENNSGILNGQRARWEAQFSFVLRSTTTEATTTESTTIETTTSNQRIRRSAPFYGRDLSLISNVEQLKAAKSVESLNNPDIRCITTCKCDF